MISVFTGCSNDSNPVSPDENYLTAPLDPFEQNKLLSRGVNIGNALEAPNEGEWGVIIKKEFFQEIKQKGFTSVRIPIKWSNHALYNAPYTIKPPFFDRINEVIKQALDQGLAVIINIHHYDEMNQNPEAHKERFLGLWKQISERYVKYPGSLFFEILNEPNSKLTYKIWNEYLKEAITVIREKNPYRTLIVGPTEWNSLYSLGSLSLPENERNIIVTYHYYNPFNFTHQGADWVEGSDIWLGTKWTGSTSEKNAVTTEFDKVLSWAITNNRPINMGEFGAFYKADLASRVLWTSYVARQAEQRNFSWNYWEFCSGFGIYDQNTGNWNTQLLNALIPGAI